MSPVETYNSAAGDCQANCETRKSNADDNDSWNKRTINQ